jgi:hypothetical protein
VRVSHGYMHECERARGSADLGLSCNKISLCDHFFCILYEVSMILQEEASPNTPKTPLETCTRLLYFCLLCHKLKIYQRRSRYKLADEIYHGIAAMIIYTHSRWERDGLERLLCPAETDLIRPGGVQEI